MNTMNIMNAWKDINIRQLYWTFFRQTFRIFTVEKFMSVFWDRNNYRLHKTSDWFIVIIKNKERNILIWRKLTLTYSYCNCYLQLSINGNFSIPLFRCTENRSSYVHFGGQIIRYCAILILRYNNLIAG